MISASLTERPGPLSMGVPMRLKGMGDGLQTYPRLILHDDGRDRPLRWPIRPSCYVEARPCHFEIRVERGDATTVA